MNNSGFIILYYALTAIILTHRYEKEHGTRNFFSIEIFLVTILFGAALQFLFYGLSPAWLSSAVGLTGLYMMQQNEIAYLDSLTDIYNRQYLDYVLASWRKKGYSFVGMMLDMDHFKQINDQFGHSTGDRAIISVANILKQVTVNKAIAFRFAGDEFIVLKHVSDAAEMDEITTLLKERVKQFNEESGEPYQIRLSYGISFFEPGQEDMDTFMKEMDMRMYEMKQKHHKEEKLSK